jgi:hypothetical protein
MKSHVISRSGALVAVFVLLCLAAPAGGAAAVLPPDVIKAPGSVRPGDAVSLTFDAGLATRCEMTFKGPGGRKTGTYRQALRGGILRAGWRVGEAVAPGTWTAAVRCTTEGTARTTKHALRVRGGHGRGSLVASKSFRFRVGQRRSGEVAQTLTDQENEAPPEEGELGAGPYDNAAIANLALSQIGQHRGQCKQAVNDWVRAVSGGGQRLGGDYHDNYAAQGGIQIGRDQAVKGDIIQLDNPANQRGYYWPMHTAVVVSHQAGSNVFDVVDSNYAGDERVRHHSYDPYRSAARRLRVTIWRMGTVAGGGSSSGPGAGSATGFEAAFQANTSDLWTVGSLGDSNWKLGMREGTSPAIAGLSTGGFQAAFQANTSDLWTVGAAGNSNWKLGMKEATSPAITGLSGGGYQVAFQANTGNLWTVGNAGNSDWKLGMMATTSPSIAGLSGGGYQVAFQANTGNLWTAGSAGNSDWKLGMMAGTSPAITALPGGGYEVAFQANTGDLWTVGTAGNNNWGLGMRAGTSPAIAALPGGGFQVAFQANTGSLWSVGTAGSGDLKLGMMDGTSPAITSLAGGGYEIAFQANTGNLWTVGGGGDRDWKLGMRAGTSPAITR